MAHQIRESIVRVLVIDCHPVESSEHASPHQVALTQLRSAGHEVGGALYGGSP